MTLMVSSNGTTRDIDLNLDFVMAYEEEHPGWSVFNVLEAQDNGVRYTDLDLVARCIGFEGIRDLVDQGFTVDDLMTAIKESKYVGFLDGTAED